MFTAPVKKTGNGLAAGCQLFYCKIYGYFCSANSHWKYDELLTLVEKWKLRWFGHVSMFSGLAKTILQGAVKGKRKCAHRKRWEDNIKKWTGMDFASSTRQLRQD